MSVPSISKEILSTGMPPMSNSPHALVTTANVSNNSQNLANFENLLPRSPYIPPDVNNTMASGNAANSLNSSSLQPPPPPPRSSAPPAHQSPKQVGKILNTLLSNYKCIVMFSSGLYVVYDRNHYFGFGPIPKPKPKLTDTFGRYRNRYHISKEKSI